MMVFMPTQPSLSLYSTSLNIFGLNICVELCMLKSNREIISLQIQLQEDAAVRQYVDPKGPWLSTRSSEWRHLRFWVATGLPVEGGCSALGRPVRAWRHSKELHPAREAAYTMMGLYSRVMWFKHWWRVFIATNKRLAEIIIRRYDFE